MNINKNSAPAVLLGLGKAALSVARSLGRRGIKVVGVAPERSLTTYSRFLTYIKESRFSSEDEKLNFYLSLGKKLEYRAVLVPTRDYTVMFASKHRDILNSFFTFFCLLMIC